MSIPKEPRQLMINIMYLVLTALLALNVSAEIFNAFKVVDKGLKESNKALDDNNAKLPAMIKERAKKKKELETYAQRVDPVRNLSKDFTKYIDDMETFMIDQTGDKDGQISDGDYITDKNGNKKYIGYKNKDITTRYLVTGDKSKGETTGEGANLKQRILDTRAKFLSFIDEKDKAAFEKQIALEIDDESWKKSINKTSAQSWEAFNFNHMPLQAALPILTKFKNDAKNTEAAVLNYLAGKVGGEELVFDKFSVVSAPKKSYIIKGEKFETGISLAATASENSNTDITLKVNGQPMRVDENGEVQWSQVANQVGVKTYSVEATVTNPVTGEVQKVNNTFEYEVGERSVSVSASKMNVFYIGVDNPVEVSAAGASSNDLKVSMSGAGGGTIKRNSDGTYTVRVTNQTKKGEFANIDVSAGPLKGSKQFRVKRIPNPVPTLSGKQSGMMGNGEFKAQGAIIPTQQGFDFDAKCNIVGFNLFRSAAREDVQESLNKGGKFSAKTQGLVNKAKPGDLYYFDNIKCKCPGDKVARSLPSATFRIK